MNTDAANRREEGSAQIVSEVHGHVDFTPPEQMVRALCSSVPIELLTYIMGQSKSTVHRWASGDVTDMSRESERRLAAAYEILQLIDRFEAPGVAATWFTCNEPQLDFVMPATALREGRLEETLAAARHCVAVGWRMFAVVASNLRTTESWRMIAEAGILTLVNENAHLLDRISIDKERCGGRPCIRLMRIRVSDIFELYAAGLSAEQILEEMPDLVEADLRAALLYAARKLD